MDKQDPKYNIDDILAEAMAHKRQRAQSSAGAAPAPKEPVEPQADPLAPKPKMVPLAPPKTPAQPVPLAPVPAPKPTPVQPPKEDKAPEKKPMQAEARTAVFPSVKPEPDAPAPAAVSAADDSEELEGQMGWDSFVPEEDAAQSVEQRLQKAREEKVRQFRLKAETQEGFKLSGDDEEANDPAEEPEVFEDSEIDDYDSYEETDTVFSELQYRRRIGWLQLALTAVLELILIAFTLIHHLAGYLPFDAVGYVLMHLFVLGVMALMNHRIVGGGLAQLVRLQANTDSPAAVAVLLALLHTAVQVFYSADLVAGNTGLLTAAAGFGLLLGAVSRQFSLCRVYDNFRFVSYPGEKFAACRIANREQAIEIGRPAVAIGDPEVTYFRRTGFLTRFLENSHAEESGVHAIRRYLGCSLVLSAALGLIYGLLHPTQIWGAITLFVTAFCLSAPLAAAVSADFPLHRAVRRALRSGAMLAGWTAVDTFGGMNALAVDALDLFPSESVMLHGIKTFSGARIDEAILDAAAVSIQAGGPLSSVFRRIIADKVDILQKVETLVYEQDMGLSGWVGGRRVLVGNRRLLENHGVDVPSKAYEAKYAKNGRQLVYLSTAGELSAMFVIRYAAEEGIWDALHNLQKADITLLVHTCEPNVTEELICDIFELDPYYIEVLPAPAGRLFEKLTAEKTEKEAAVLASNGRLSGMATALTCCRRLRTAAVLAVVLVIVCGGLGLALAAVTGLYAGILLPPLYVLGYSALCTFLSLLLPLFKRI